MDGSGFISELFGKLMKPYISDSGIPALRLGVARLGDQDFCLLVHNQEGRSASFWLQTRILISHYTGDAVVQLERWVQLSSSQPISQFKITLQEVPVSLLEAKSPAPSAYELKSVAYVAWLSATRPLGIQLKGRFAWSSGRTSFLRLWLFVLAITWRGLLKYVLYVGAMIVLLIAKK